jgi:SAM-dependent methyltransferase
MPSVNGPVLEIGSKDYGSTEDFRKIYAGHEYVGVDLAEGPGVDIVADLTAGIGPLAEGHFDLVICCSVLEHTPRPWDMAANIARLVRPKGWLYIAVPWVWRYHPYPDDYFRFSHRAIESLFPAFYWSDIVYSTNVTGEMFELDPQKPGLDDELAVFAEVEGGRRKHLPYLQVHMFGLKT